MHPWVLKIIEGLTVLKVKGLPALPSERSYSLRCYPSFLELVASRINGLSDVGLGPIFTDLRGKGDEHEEHGGVTREIRGQTQITSKSC